MSTEVITSILNLQNTLEIHYMRSRISLLLEADAFYRLLLETKGLNISNSLTPEEYATTSFELSGPCGPIKIIRNSELGTSSYAKVYT